MDKSNEHQWYAEVTVAITGASGAQYGIRLIECLLAANCRVHLMVSSAARVVICTETEHVIDEGFEGLTRWAQASFQASEGQLALYDKHDWFAPCASGSSRSGAMVICPASGGTLSSIAYGASNNLIERAADVMIKERRKLIIVPRETPVSEIHLENMLKLTRMGCVMLPASPGFYQAPSSIGELIDFIVARILDQLEVPQTLFPRWGE